MGLEKQQQEFGRRQKGENKTDTHIHKGVCAKILLLIAYRKPTVG